MDTYTEVQVKAVLTGMLREDDATEKSVMAEATKLCSGDEALGMKLLTEVCEAVAEAQGEDEDVPVAVAPEPVSPKPKVKPKKPRKRYKTVQCEAALDEVLDAAELESLRDEMTDWRDNMEGTGLENTDKFEQVSEAADILEEQVYVLSDAIDSLNLSGHGDLANAAVKWAEQHPYGKRAWPRWLRHSTAVPQLTAALAVLAEADGADKYAEQRNDIETAIDELNTVEYPTMF